MRYGLLVIAVVAQLATVVITEPLWGVRATSSGTAAPNLPALDLPQLPFGWLMVLSLLFTLIVPRRGVWLHLGVYAVACLFDQLRIQPQLMGVAVLILAMAIPKSSPLDRWNVARWYLVAMWFWAGLHKLLSPDWFTYCTWNLFGEAGLQPDDRFLWVAYMIAWSEIALALMAFFIPKLAAVGCVLLHGGIALYLLPWLRNWNASVIPWNLATAIVGYWILRRAPLGLPRTRGEWVVAVVLLVLPATFYLGLVDHRFAHVLYSDHVPEAVATASNGTTRQFSAWEELRVPFPHVPRLFKQHFALTSEPGEKLHIRDPHARMPDSYFLIKEEGPEEISAKEFYRADSEPLGAGIDSLGSVFRLASNDVRLLKRDAAAMIYAVEFPPGTYSVELLQELRGLPNLEQIQLAETQVRDEDLKWLTVLKKLHAIGLDGTQISDRAVEILQEIPTLRIIEHKGTAISESAMIEFLESRRATNN